MRNILQWIHNGLTEPRLYLSLLAERFRSLASLLYSLEMVTLKEQLWPVTFRAKITNPDSIQLRFQNH